VCNDTTARIATLNPVVTPMVSTCTIGTKPSVLTRTDLDARRRRRIDRYDHRIILSAKFVSAGVRVHARIRPHIVVRRQRVNLNRPQVVFFSDDRPIKYLLRERNSKLTVSTSATINRRVYRSCSSSQRRTPSENRKIPERLSRESSENIRKSEFRSAS